MYARVCLCINKNMYIYVMYVFNGESMEIVRWEFITLYMYTYIYMYMYIYMHRYTYTYITLTPSVCMHVCTHTKALS